MGKRKSENDIDVLQIIIKANSIHGIKEQRAYLKSIGGFPDFGGQRLWHLPHRHLIQRGKVSRKWQWLR